MCTVDGATVTSVVAGTCTIRAEQPGDSVYRSATPVNRTFTVAKVAQTITFPTIATKTLAESPLTVTATSLSGLPVSFTTTTLDGVHRRGHRWRLHHPVGHGDLYGSREQVGDDYWRAVDPAVNRSFTVTLPQPAVSSFAASPTLLSSAGGVVDLSGTATSADTCRFTVSPALTGFPLTVPCTGGSASATA